MTKTILERGRPQVTIRRKRIACWIPMATHTHTLRLRNTHCFFTPSMAARTLLAVTLYAHCLTCYLSIKKLGKRNCEGTAFQPTYLFYPIMFMTLLFFLHPFYCFSFIHSSSGEGEVDPLEVAVPKVTLRSPKGRRNFAKYIGNKIGTLFSVPFLY
jgi:hypothetical protein